MNICDAVTEERVIVGLKNTDKAKVLEEILTVATTSGQVKHSERVLQCLLDREQLQTTGVGSGLAIPHAKTDDVEGVVLTIGTSKDGVDYDSLDGEPVHLIFMLTAGADKNSAYLSVLAKIARIFKNETLRQAVIQADSPAAIMNLIREREQGGR